MNVIFKQEMPDMAEIVFKIVAVALTLVGVAGVLLTCFASVMAAATNYDEATKIIRGFWVPFLVALVGAYFCFKAF